jgi:hypothetical protein
VVFRVRLLFPSSTCADLISRSVTDILVGSLNSYHTTHETPEFQDAGSPHQESTVATATIKMPEPVIYTPGTSSRSSSVFVPSGRSSGEHGVYIISDDGYDSPPPVDERIAEIKNERRYRLLLTHAFHSSRKLFHFYSDDKTNGLPSN